MLAAGLEILVIGTWLYMRTALGASPRDSLMVALARKTGRSVGICRATVEIAVIAAGWLLGGQVGIGTVISAVGLGSLFNLNFKLLHFRASESAPGEPSGDSCAICVSRAGRPPEHLSPFHTLRTEKGGTLCSCSELIYFVTVAEQGSINKAAEKLFITQPNLSKAISNLENELKVRVFNRTNKGVALTDGGKKLYQYARTILNQMELIQGLSQKDRPRTLSIAAYPIITMGRLVAEFHNAHRQDTIEIKLVERRLRERDGERGGRPGGDRLRHGQQCPAQGVQAHHQLQESGVPPAGQGHLVPERRPPQPLLRPKRGLYGGSAGLHVYPPA
ncbi:MAG: LysR family transcriptional regulator [Flavonifractor plautii]